MKRVLITRPEPGATETAVRLTASGFLPVIAPILSIIGSEVRAPHRVAATILTSRNAVAACKPSLYHRPVFTVGGATADLAARAGFSRVFNADGDAGTLADMIADKLSPADGPLFLPTGQGHGLTLAAALRLHGFRVMRRIAYQAACVPVLPKSAETHLAQGLLSAALFFSGETARHFVRLIQVAGLVEAIRGVEAVSISTRAAVPLSPLPWRRISVAAKPNQDAMLALLK